MILYRDRAAAVLYEVLMTLDKQYKFLLPLNICPIVPDTFLKAGVKFKFIDINLNSLCMDENLAIEAIKNDNLIGGVLFVNTFGLDIDTESFYKTIKYINRDIFIIDDQCLSVPDFNCEVDNSYASLRLFSSGYSKYVDLGYGGFGFLKNSQFTNVMNDNSNDSEFIKYRENIENKIPLMTQHKLKINLIYRQGIPNEFHLGEAFEKWRFSILTDNKEALLEKIFMEKGLFASSHFAPIDNKYTDKPIQISNAKEISSRIINLFNDYRFSEEKAHKTVKVIRNFLKTSEPSINSNN